MDGWSDKAKDRLFRAIFVPSSAEYQEVQSVSIQIRDMANPAAQQEVRERIRGLIEAAALVAHEDGHPNAKGVTGADRLREEVTAFHIALIGYAPTGDQLKEVFGE